jgi:hypothetical protein
MSQDHQQSQAPPGDDSGMIPVAGALAAAKAAELVVHGVLESLRAGPQERERRVTRVMEAVSRPAPLAFPWRRTARLAMAAAALLAIGAAIYFIGVPGERTALAEVNGAAAALRGSGDLRYEVRLETWPQNGETEGGSRLGAVVDSREAAGTRLILVEHWPPGAKAGVFVGRDEKGKWARRSDGQIDRSNPRRSWPPFSVDGQQLTVESLDTLLEQLPRRYTLERGKRATLEGGGREFDRVSARRNDHAGPFPQRVELWIDPRTRLAERIEFRWDEPLQSGPGGGGPSPGDDRGPPPMPPDEEGGPGGPPPHDHGPDGHGPHGGARPAPLKLIAFQRVTAPVFPADWFTPEGHTSK